MWGRFWDSFGSGDQHESESQISDPLSSQLLSAHSQHSNGNNSNAIARAISPEPSASFPQLQGFSEITPNESASMVARNEDGRSCISEDLRTLSNKGEDVFSFKFTTSGGKTHRFASVYDSYPILLEAVRQKVIGEHLAHLGSNVDDVPVESWLSISYLDDEDDQVLITSDADVVDAVKLARKMGQDRVKLFVHDATEKEPEAPVVEEAPVVIEQVVAAPVIAPSPPPPTIEITEAHQEQEKKTKKRSIKKEVPVSEDEDEEQVKRHSKHEGATVAGIPQELILPAAIAFLGVVIVGVFAFSRVSSNHR
jgi:hypothetical protein